MKEIKKKARHLLMATAILLLLGAGNMTTYAANTPSVEYILYNVNGEIRTGMDWKAAGDTSQSHSEKNDYWNSISMNISNNLTGHSGGIMYAIHVHDVGWSSQGGKFAVNGQKLFYDKVNGFTTKYPWIEAVSAELTGELKDYYYINYNTRISPLSQTFRDSPDITVDENRYQRGLKFFHSDAKKTNYWTGFDEDLSKVLGDGYNEEGLANDGGLNFAGTWGMAMPISAFRAELCPFQVKLTIEPNGGIYSDSTSNRISWPEADSTVNIATPTRTGYTFTGWKMLKKNMTDIKDSKEALKKNKQQYPDNNRLAKWSTKNKELKLGNQNVILTAQWKENNYTIAYNGNGHTSGSTSSQTATYNKALNLQSNGFQKTGHIFTGWNTKKDGSGASYNSGQRVKKLTATAGGKVTLYAQWEGASYTLTVKPNGGTWEGKTTDQIFTLKYGETKTIANPSRTGYTFDGWIESGTKSSMPGRIFTMGRANAVLMANWKANTYTIVFNGNGATEGSMESITATVDALPFQLPTNQFKRTTEHGESRFLGWALVPQPEGNTPEFKEPIEVDKNLAQKQDETVTLYAIWDDCPAIDVSNRYFTLQAAKEGVITEEELLSTATATDLEDVTLENRTSVQIAESGINGSLSLYGYAAWDFTNMIDSGSVSIIYKAVDNVGNTVYETVTVYITNTEPIAQTDFQYTRFINEKYYSALQETGGLHPESIWLNNPDYKNILEEALKNLKNNTPIATYSFNNEKVIEVQRYIENIS